MRGAARTSPARPTVRRSPLNGAGTAHVAPLVGRDIELRALVAAITAPPSVVLVEGEAGIGKTRLVDTALHDPAVTGRDGITIVTGRGLPLREPFPCGAVLQGLSGLGPSLPAPDTLNPVTGVLRGPLPELAPHLPRPPTPLGDPAAERHRMFRAVRALLAALGRSCLVIEDLHWADDGSRDLLRFLTADPPPDLSIVLTCRPEDTPPNQQAGSTIPRSAIRIALRPLPLMEVRRLASALLGGPVSVEFAAATHERTAGIPLVVEETLRGLRAGATELPEVRDHTVPAVLREAMAERLARLPRAAIRVVHAAAVLAGPVDEDLLGEVADTSPDTIGDLLTQALRNGALHEVDGRYGFRHALAQRAAYDTIDGPRRRRLHQRAAAALGGRLPIPLVELAEHHRRAGQHEDWLRHAEAAADHAVEVGDVSSAIESLSELLDDHAVTGADLRRLAVKLARVAAIGVDQTAMITMLRDLVEDPRLNAPTRGEVRQALGLLLIRQSGSLEQARVELTRAVDELDEEPALACRAMTVLATPISGTRPLAEHVQWARRVEDLTDRVTDQRLRTMVLANGLATKVLLGDPGAWSMIRDLPTRGQSTAERSDLVRVHANLAYACAWTGHYGRAREWLTSAERIMTSAGLPYTAASARATEVQLDWCTGTWSDLAERAHDLIDGYPDLWPVAAEMSYVLGALDVARGEAAQAKAHLDDSGLADPANAFTPVVMAAHAAVVRLLLPNGDAAAPEADRALDSLRHKGIWALSGDIAPAAAAAYAAAGRVEGLAGFHAELEQALRGLDAPLAHAGAQVCRAWLAVAEGRTAQAVEDFDLAADRYDELPAPYYATMAREQAARHRQAMAKPAGLSAVADRYEELGAVRDAARCRHTLRKTGLGTISRRGRRGYGDELSPREQEVLGLLRHGRTNRDIAEVLFLSPRTVEYHIARLLKKLDVTSRDDLIRQAAARDGG